MSYLFVTTEGPTIYFDGAGGRVTASGLETISEVCLDVLPLSFMFAGSRFEEWAKRWAHQISELVSLYCSGTRRLAFEYIEPSIIEVFAKQGVATFSAASLMQMARAIKSPEEILCMNHAIAIAEDGMWCMRSALRPGLTEIELWSLLWRANISAGGDWIEGRLLSAGDRTNPWLQEASSRKIRPGELVCFDTDMIGPLGYSADISRTLHCGPGAPTAYQKDLYRRAYDEIHHNIQLMQPGATFRDIARRSYKQDEKFRDQHYVCISHGIGLADEWPVIYYPQEEAMMYDGELMPGMAICVESYVGELGGREGVKLEQQILITEDGNELLSKFPFEREFLV
jgi:Xaa-Pro aminopeptidase